MLKRAIFSGIDLANELGVLRRLQLIWASRLTVLAYHRIVDPLAPSFRGLADNASTRPQDFGEQLDLLRNWFTIIAPDALLAWVQHGRPLPRCPLLITFDDGYRDVGDVAWAALRQRGLPAVLFVTTGQIGSRRPFWWDLAADAFARSSLGQADLPLLGPRPLGDALGRQRLLREWIAHARRQPASRMFDLATATADRLGVAIDPDSYDDLYLDWQQIRTMAAQGLDIGAHTMSHPALTRAPPEQVWREAVGSRQRLEAELGVPVRSFAYPFGGAGDFGSEHEGMLRDAGFTAAFTLIAGPQSVASARREPMRLRRINVHYKDDTPRLLAKLLGASLVRSHLANRDRRSAAHRS